MRNLPPPHWLRTFESAARLGGFAAAALELSLTPAAVSQQIRALEGHLGHKLFLRRAKGVTLTDLGHAYLPMVRRAFDDLALATRGVFGDIQPGMLIVRAPPSFAALRLAPALARFRRLHPQIAIRLSSAIWADAPSEGAVDVDIRYGDGRWPVSDIRRLTEPRSIAVCPAGSPAQTLAAAGLETLAIIDIMGCESFWERLLEQNGMAGTRLKPALSADSSLVALEMVASGLGVALLARDLAWPYLESGRVARLMDLELRHDQAHYVLLPETSRPRPQARLFRDWLLAEFAS